MKKGIIGKKIGMTQIFDEIGNVIPVTVIQAGPCVVAQKKTVETDGYDAVQLGFAEVKEKHMTKAEIGHFAKAGVANKKHLKEFRLDDVSAINVGDVITADTFAAGDKVDVTGMTKGHGYSGVIKRWNHSHLRMTHGTGPTPKRVPTRLWEDHKELKPWDFYGGDLKGIREKLPYLRELGITGIYMTPFFLSNSNHKYNTFSYETIDPDFGTEEDMVALVEDAHSMGIRVMMDAVFNHSGTEFAPWRDVLKNGPASRYWDWFFVNQWPLPREYRNTEDGKFFTFAFTPMMPKLNTNNPDVADYCLQRCKYWTEHWHIDGIRFDVGNEVAHSFLKKLHAGLKAINPDLFLLGEIWHDSIQWLQGDEYDSVMNYPFMESLHNFWLDEQDAQELMYALNRCYSLYPSQINPVLFNFLDTHDTMRALTRCGSKDVFYQQLALLMTMPGSACIYYGTELAMEGGNDPDCRRPMLWNEMGSGSRMEDFRQVQALIGLRNHYPQLRWGRIRWELEKNAPKLIRYSRVLAGREAITVCINTAKTSTSIPNGKVLFSRNLEGGNLLPGGVAILSM